MKKNDMCSAFWAGMYFEMIDVNKYKLTNVNIPFKDITDKAKFVLAIRGFMETFTTQNKFNTVYLTIGESDIQIDIEKSKIKDIKHIKGKEDYTGDLMGIGDVNGLLSFKVKLI